MAVFFGFTASTHHFIRPAPADSVSHLSMRLGHFSAGCRHFTPRDGGFRKKTGPLLTRSNTGHCWRRWWTLSCVHEEEFWMRIFSQTTNIYSTTCQNISNASFISISLHLEKKKNLLMLFSTWSIVECWSSFVDIAAQQLPQTAAHTFTSVITQVQLSPFI